ncbi:MAG: ribosome small subunit-dependent GTPase A [Defluviitaleaceae bacterium]|nr:ribosome small subunit-dependent GTPase A [Defluviitaleaceae bacterium]
MTDLKQYGYTKTSQTTTRGSESGPDTIPGRVTEHRRDMYTVITRHGELAASLKGTYYHGAVSRNDFPCVGDFVLLQYNNSGESRIASLLPRWSKFSRADFSGHAAGYVKTIQEQVVAANFDYVFILSSLNQDFKVSRITRYLTQTYASGGQPVVILTKADLADDIETPLAMVQRAAPDVPVIAVSAHTGDGLGLLSEFLMPGKTIVFLGMSGVGKSSLLNALMDAEVMLVKGIREDDSRGRHTTTHRQLFMLPSGAMVIDTPGMRELGLFDADEGISAGFSDVEDLFSQCRFSDCGHKTEPGCAVRAALTSGELPIERWERYQAQRRENRFVDNKASFMREKQAFQKSIALYSKSKKKKR